MQNVFANGAKIPAIGFGTYGTVRDEMLRTLPSALKAGFRHVDTAQIYRNEMDVGECVASSGVPRSEIFLTTKVWVANYPEDRFASSVDQSLRNLRTDYVDLLLLHWPHDGVPLAEQIGLLPEIAARPRPGREDDARLALVPLEAHDLDETDLRRARAVRAAARRDAALVRHGAG